MSKQIQIPDIGSDEVTVTEVMVKVGDTITADQSIINVTVTSSLPISGI